MSIVLGIFIGLVIAAALVLVGVNIYVRVTYSDFYEKAETAVVIPGLESGFVPQDIDYLKAHSMWLYSGYDGNGGPSPIYRRSADGTESHVFVNTPEGNPYDGHGGGITSSDGTDGYVYLTCEDGYLVMNTRDVATADEGDTVQAFEHVSVGLAPAFINIQNNVMYTGVFYNGDQYTSPPEMTIECPDGTVNHAIMLAFPLDEDAPCGVSETPEAAYSIPDKVQGVSITRLGHFVFSTSWGLEPSRLIAHNATLVTDRNYMSQGVAVPLFCLDGNTYVGEIVTPPMSEGIVMINGDIYISYESACNKYFFGKLYGARNVMKMDVAL